MRSVKRHGMTMLELVMVVVGIALLSSMLVSGLSKANEDAKLDIVYTDQSIFATDFEAILQKVGALSLDASTSMENRELLVKEYLINLQSNYLHTYLDFETLRVTASGFEIYTKESVDPWGGKYLIAYVTSPVADSEATPGDTMIISGGPNMEIERDNYVILDFSDDKILLIDVKETTFGSK